MTTINPNFLAMRPRPSYAEIRARFRNARSRLGASVQNHQQEIQVGPLAPAETPRIPADPDMLRGFTDAERIELEARMRYNDEVALRAQQEDEMMMDPAETRARELMGGNRFVV
jgi:hypothetical protein